MQKTTTGDKDEGAEEFDAGWSAFNLFDADAAEKLFLAGSSSSGPAPSSVSVKPTGKKNTNPADMSIDQAYKAGLNASTVTSSKSVSLEALILDLKNNKHYEKALKKTSGELLAALESTGIKCKQIFLKKCMKLDQVQKTLREAAELIQTTNSHIGLLKKL